VYVFDVTTENTFYYFLLSNNVLATGPAPLETSWRSLYLKLDPDPCGHSLHKKQYLQDHASYVKGTQGAALPLREKTSQVGNIRSTGIWRYVWLWTACDRRIATPPNFWSPLGPRWVNALLSVMLEENHNVTLVIITFSFWVNVFISFPPL
jgi:hypothetical protein